MSRSNPNQNTEKPINPAQLFIDWDSDNKQFKYYDKEKKENVAIPLPFSFLVLDTLATIKGWSPETDSGIWSNEVKDLKKQPLTIMTKNGKEATGLYENIKGKVNGAKYCQSVYIAFPHNKKIIMANIQMKGAALGAWIEFCSPPKGTERPNLWTGAVTVKSTEQGKVGKIVFNKPVFTYIKDVKEETQNIALELSKQLDAYLVEYFAYINQFESKEEIPKEEAIKPNVEFIAPQTGRATVKLQEESNPVVPADEEFNDLPF